MGCSVDTRLAPHVGLCRPIRPPRNLILHLQSGRSIDPKAGQVYGAAGTPVGHVWKDGYVRIGITRDGHQYAHRLIYEACHGPIQPGLCIDHKNGNRADNRISNLDAVTPAENVARALERGSFVLGDAASFTKLTAAVVRAIRQSSVPTREWARQLGLDPATIRRARRGTTWRHVATKGRLAAKPKWRRPK